MSCYNWERGTIKIPSKEWKGLRDRLVDEANARREKLFQQAVVVWECLSNQDNINAAREAAKTQNRVLRPKERIKLSQVTPFFIFKGVNDEFDRLHYCLRGVAAVAGARLPYKTDQETVRAIESMLFPYVYETGERKRLAKPKKSNDLVKPLVRTKVQSISAGDACLIFDHKGKAITWNVTENNRAVEHARKTWLAKTLFPALRQITWTRGSGGTIVGNDEYNRESDYAGGGANYVRDEFGPNVKQPRRSRYAFGF